MQDHIKDAEFLNCPIRFYIEMEAIFGHGMATGRFAQGSGDALGVKGEDSVAAKAEGTHIPHPSAIKTQTELAKDSKATELLSSAVGGKRKRGHFTEDEMLMLTNMMMLTMWLVLLGKQVLHMLMLIFT
jgi:hypothetical protein